MSGWTEEGLLRSWRALAQQESVEQWRFVRLANPGTVVVEAGCHFPAGREALVASFPGTQSVNPARLPDGKGFDISCIDPPADMTGRTAIALVRRQEGPLDIFAIMVVDVLRVLEAAALEPGRSALDVFLERVREWQTFMSRKHRPLSSDAQIGLFGELYVLRSLAESSLGCGAALDCWRGPLRAAQDFHLRTGSIEVKSTVRKGHFLARINSIEQLDSDRSPNFLCALRFELNESGQSLVDLVGELREKFRQHGNQRGFEALLMVMGYLDEHAPQYGRCLSLRETKVFRSEGDMPRLIRASLPAAVRAAVYTLDIDAVEVQCLEFDELKEVFGLN